MAKIDLSALPSPRVLVEDKTQDQQFAIDVQYKRKSDKWSATCAQSGLSGEAQSLVEALHDLANQYERRDLFGSDRFDPNATHTHARTKKCVYCLGRMFFAETINGKWMPIDAESVPATMLGNARAYRLASHHGGTRAPQAEPITRRYQGEVWIAHPMVCGATPVPPESPFLRGRWEKNRGITVKASTDAVHDLQRMASELTPTVREQEAA